MCSPSPRPLFDAHDRSEEGALRAEIEFCVGCGLSVDLGLEGVAASLCWSGLCEPTPEWARPQPGFWPPDRRWNR